jgi:hypothetical protein
MAIFIKLIADYALWLYAFLGFGILFFLRLVIIARREQEIAVFSLEREAAVNKGYRAALSALLLVLLAVGVYYVSNVLAERVPMPGNVEPTATPLLFLTPTPTPAPPTATPTATNTPRPLPTLLPLPTDTPAALPTPTAPPAACPNPNVRITYPPMHAVVNGVVQIVGSANIDNLDYYKFEYRPLGVANWTFLQRFSIPVKGGVLGAWDTGTVDPGEYEVRLVVVDVTGNYPEPCVIALTVVR